MSKVFDSCVYFLDNVAYILDISYEELNVWVFCILNPALILFLAYKAYWKRKPNLK